MDYEKRLKAQIVNLDKQIKALDPNKSQQDYDNQRLLTFAKEQLELILNPMIAL